MRRAIGRRLRVAGVRRPVHVREDGPAGAPVLVLLHGFSGSLHWFDRAVPHWADRFRLVRVDLLGHGSTGGPPADAPAQARMVAGVLEALNVEDVTIVGHSFGADVAVELAEHSSRVTRLVIVAQAPDYSDATLPRGRWLMTVPVLSTVLGGSFQLAALVLGTVSALGRGHPAGRELARQGLLDFRALRVGMFRVVLVTRRDRMARRPLDAQVRAAGKPTLVVLGGRDHFYGDRSAPRYRAAGAEVRVLPDCGHSPFVELPAESAALVAGFAARLPVAET